MDILKLLASVDTSGIDKAINKLGNLGSAAKSAQQQTTGLSGQVQGVGQAGSSVTSAANNITGVGNSAVTAASRVAVLASGVVAIGVAAASAVAGVVALSLQVAEAAGAMEDLSFRTNVATERLSLYDALAKMAGSSVEELVTSSERLATKLAREEEGSGRAAAALKQLGISTKDANGETKSMLKLQEDIVLAADKATDKARAEGAAVQLLGNDYYKLRNAVRETATQKSDMYDYMQRVGAVVTTDLARQSGALGDNIDKVKVAFTGMANSVARITVPILNTVMARLVSITSTAAELINRYTGGETASEKTDAALDALYRQRDAAQKTVNKIEGTEYANTGQGAKALEDARAKVTVINDQIREMQRLKNAADAAAASVKNAVTNGAPKEGNAVAGADGKSNKPADPTKTDSYRQAMAEAQERQRARKDEYDAANQFSITQKTKKLELDHQQYLAHKREAEALLDLLNPMRALDRQIKAINDNTQLSLEQKESLVVAVSEKWVNAQAKMKDSLLELNDTGRFVFGGIENSIINAAKTGEFSFKSLAASFIEQLFRMYVQAQIIGPLIKALSGTSVGSFFGLKASASGNVFGSTGILKSASGNVFDRPTLHGYGDGKLGLLGEAGPEAIVPLKRGANGQLGVQVQGGGGSGGMTIGGIYVTVEGGKDANETGQIVGREVRKQIEAIALNTIATQRRPGGLLAG